MTLSGFIRSSILAIALGAATSAALAAAAVAVGDGNYTHTSRDYDNIAAASAAALKGCAEEVANCKILITSAGPGAIALAKADNGMFASAQPTPEAAQKAALAGCRKSYKNCKFTALYWEEGATWAAWGYAKDPAGNLASTFFTYEADSEAGAKEEAIQGCEKRQTGDKPYKCEASTRQGDWAYVEVTSPSHHTVQLDATLNGALASGMSTCKAQSRPGDVCKATAKFFNQGGRKAPASFARLASLTETARQARQAQRREVTTHAVQNLSCTNNCMNGSCVRTFPNGRTEHWQAPRVFDPFTNDWKWDTSSCGG